MKVSRESFVNLNIFIEQGENECIGHAAERLQFYLQRITGFLFGIRKVHFGTQNGFRLFFGESCFDYPLKDDEFDLIADDGFVINGNGTCLCIEAVTERGVLYGVFDYLERFYGTRFLTNDFEYIPRSDTVVFPDKLSVSNPDFLMRGYFIGDTYDDLSRCGQVDYDFVDKNRTKDIFMKIPLSHGGPHKVYGRNFVHNFHYFVPFEKYGNEHPEWYRFFYELERITPTIDITNGITDDGQLDESMEISVAKIVISEMISDAEQHPDKKVFNLTQEDGEHYFEGERADRLAAKYKRSGILVRFCNVIVREVNRYLQEKYNRTIKIITFAYAYSREAPVKLVNGKYCPIDETVVADENLIIQLALFANGAYSYFSEHQDEIVRRVMEEWKSSAKNFWFWMYDINFHKYLYYYDSFDQINDNVQGFKKYGISYLAVNGPLEEGRSWQCNIRAYAYRKLMWDTSLDANSLMDEYIDLYYGIAAPCVKQVIQLFRDNALESRKDENYRLATRGSCEQAKYTPKQLLVDILDVIAQGEREIQASPMNEGDKSVYLEHLYAVKATPLLMLYDLYFEYTPDGSLEEYLSLKEEFFDTVHKAKIHMAGEHWTMDQFRKECDDADKKAGRTHENVTKKD